MPKDFRIGTKKTYAISLPRAGSLPRLKLSAARFLPRGRGKRDASCEERRAKQVYGARHLPRPVIPDGPLK